MHNISCAVYSLYTTLSLEWEPDLIAISVLYLSCRLTKFEVTDWVDKPDNYAGKWYAFFVKDVSLDIIESKLLNNAWLCLLLLTKTSVYSYESPV